MQYIVAFASPSMLFKFCIHFLRKIGKFSPSIPKKKWYLYKEFRIPSQRLNFKTSGLHDYRWTRNMVKKYSISYLVNHWNFSSHNINPLHTLMTKVKVRHFTASTDNLAQRLSIYIYTHTYILFFFFFSVSNLNLIVSGLPREIIQLLPSQRKKPKLFNPGRKTYDK